MSHVSQLTRFSSTGFAGCARPSVHGTLRECGFRTDELGGRAEFQSARQTQARRAAENTLQNIWHGGAMVQALPVNGLEQSGMASCVQAVQRAWNPFIVDALEATRELAFVHGARPPLLPSLKHVLCVHRVWSACGRRRLLLLLWSQDRRESTARRCGSLLYIGLHRAQQFVAMRAAADERAAWIPLECCGTAVATVARSCSAACWPPQASGA